MDLETQDLELDLPGGVLHARRIRHLEPMAGERPELVLLHEALGCVAMWRDFPEELAARTGCDALLYDRLGHGRSDPDLRQRTSGFLHIEALEVLPRVLETCGIAQPVLVGHSDGASIALIHAASRSNVCAVVSEAAHVMVEPVTLRGIRDKLEESKNSPLLERLAKYHGADTEAIFHAWAGIWLAEEFQDWNIEALLPQVQCPVLAIQGERDEYGSADQVHPIVGNVSGPAESWLIPDCGHVPHLERQHEVLERIAVFLQQHRLLEGAASQAGTEGSW